jgi:hypothetical protein
MPGEFPDPQLQSQGWLNAIQMKSHFDLLHSIFGLSMEYAECKSRRAKKDDRH